MSLANRLFRFHISVGTANVIFGSSLRLLGRVSDDGGTGEEITIGTGLALSDGALVVDASYGGLGAADSGKLAKFAVDGGLACSSALGITDGDNNPVITLAYSENTPFVTLQRIGGSALNTLEVSFAGITGSKAWTVPNLSGTIGILAPFENQAAAIAAGYSSGDDYFDTTANRARTVGTFPVGSLGGNGGTDAGKFPVFGTFGEVVTTWSLAINSADDTAGIEFITNSGMRTMAVYNIDDNPLNSLTISFLGITGPQSWTVANLSGVVAVAPTHADDAAAASAGLAVGDLYFTGTKFRVRTT